MSTPETLAHTRTDCSTTVGLVPPFYFNIHVTSQGNECYCCPTCEPRYDVDWATFLGVKDAATFAPTVEPTQQPTSSPSSAPTSAPTTGSPTVGRCRENRSSCAPWCSLSLLLDSTERANAAAKCCSHNFTPHNRSHLCAHSFPDGNFIDTNIFIRSWPRSQCLLVLCGTCNATLLAKYRPRRPPVRRLRPQPALRQSCPRATPQRSQHTPPPAGPRSRPRRPRRRFSTTPAVWALPRCTIVWVSRP